MLCVSQERQKYDAHRRGKVPDDTMLLFGLADTRPYLSRSLLFSAREHSWTQSRCPSPYFTFSLHPLFRMLCACYCAENEGPHSHSPPVHRVCRLLDAFIVSLSNINGLHMKNGEGIRVSSCMYVVRLV